jgi:hypothetical protein
VALVEPDVALHVQSVQPVHLADCLPDRGVLNIEHR